ncbi:unnamed protein product [Macrosiphum euphorbiae]|uniref:THAP-type domain-containing protein n=1 Tax=Macrosiphum euphorbiae TaxID=13131 RepID=A0AAV0Y5A3_9HEMI|nr:unnamed protein product [Macrosiphum euphorbiae]
MPGHRCIVPGCKSGYDSCVNKYHFFTVPKDLAKLELWKKAIPRKEFVFKPRQVHSEEIIAFAIRYYINMRMRQFSQKCNAETKKENMIKKKVSKFTLS